MGLLSHRSARPAVRASTLEFVTLVIIAFCLATQAIQQVMNADSDTPGGSLTLNLIFMAMYVVVGVLALRRMTAVLGTLAASSLMTLVVLLPMISLLWSTNQLVTLQRAVAAVGSSLIGIYLVTRLDLKRLIRFLGIVYGLAAAGSLFVSVAVPSIGIMKTEAWAGTWRGLYPHKNGLGAAMAVGSFVLIYGLALARGRLRLLFAIGLMFSLVMLVQARSTTAVVTFAFVLVLMGWCWVVQRWPGPMTAMSMAGAGVVLILATQAIAMAGLGGLFALLGKSADISGRIPLWELAIAFVRERPWLGRGYEAFWVLNSPQYDFITAQLHYAPFYSHNGIIETMLNGGIVTLALVLLALFASLWRGFVFLTRERFIYASFPFVFFVYFITSNVSESRILARNDLIWVLFVALGFQLARQVRVRWAPGPRRLATLEQGAYS